MNTIQINRTNKNVTLPFVITHISRANASTTGNPRFILETSGGSKLITEANGVLSYSDILSKLGKELGEIFEVPADISFDGRGSVTAVIF